MRHRGRCLVLAFLASVASPPTEPDGGASPCIQAFVVARHGKLVLDE